MLFAKFFLKVNPILEGTTINENSVKKFKRQVIMDPKAIKWRMIFGPCSKTCGGGENKFKLI